MNKDVMRDVSMDGHDFDLVRDHAGAMDAGPLSPPVKPRAPSAASSTPVSAAEAVARGWLSNAEYVDLMASLEEELMADVRADGALGGGVALCSLLPHSARSLVMISELAAMEAALAEAEAVPARAQVRYTDRRSGTCLMRVAAFGFV